MKLWDFYKAWERYINEDLIVYDGKDKNYHLNSIPLELWDKKVKAFYFEDNNLIVRL